MTPFAQLWQHWGSWLIAGLIAAASLGFLLRFALPALGLGRRLRAVLRNLEALTPTAGPSPSQAPSPTQVAAALAPLPALGKLWREYAQTLHRMAPPSADAPAPGWRSTASAGHFFTEEAIVEVPLKAEFYKHLPGILTGIGIIGTFSGLIAGLSQFEVTNDAEVVRGSLRGLIQGVGHAFEISAAAIAAAMLITWIEKSLVTRCYGQVERLCQLIDGLFDAGVGEEYLARLVRASESAATQGAQLRQAIVVELRQSLGDMLTQQAAAAQQQQAQLAAQIAQSVAQAVAASLRQPLERITTALERLGSDQGQAIGHTLETILARQADSFDSQLGSQQQHLAALLAHNAQSFETVIDNTNRLLTHLDQQGRQGVTQATGQLTAAGQDVQRMASALAEAVTLSGQDMTGAAQAMSQAAQVAGRALGEQQALREDLARLVADLRATMESARREASLTGTLVGRLEGAAGTLAQASHEADDYLARISEVLTQAHGAFAQHIEQTLARGNQQFQYEVAQAVDALHGAVEELADALAVAQPAADIKAGQAAAKPARP